ncbi:hypothetical protein KPH14_011868 [Odynerus spinipes]|uniref:PiggyBac transposable element-derived protein domain-containing protein n=1 Tax=Odynerus spinipes TaxID=1348599 RepID=A0AAD9VKG6_9HYME|nr:hypothetical protein KPH14_011868 [Odynerus spinipes]
MWAFIGVIINMGTMPLAKQEYWSRNDISYIPFYSNKFTRDRLNQIFWMLHLKTIQRQDAGPRTRLQLVGCFLDYINSKFLKYFTPGREICVDESTIKFKGRISFITYNPKKPTKWGIRVYMMADSSTGCICSILPYYGSLATDKLIRSDLPVSTRIPLHLYVMLLEKIPGTNRKHIPKQIKRTKFGKKSTVAYRKTNTLVLAWKDKRVVTCLVNWNNAGMTPVKRILRGGVEVTVKKPNVVIDYIKHMGGVNRADQYASTYCFLRKSLKWWRKLFFWGLEISSKNSYILYKATKQQRSEQRLNHLRYLKALVHQLTGDVRQSRNRASTSISDSEEIRLNGKLHNLLTGVRKDCKVCSQRNKPGKRHQTTYYCNTCPDKPGMHLGNCYMKYHTQKNYRD